MDRQTIAAGWLALRPFTLADVADLRPPGKRSRSLLDPLAWVRTLLRTPVIGETIMNMATGFGGRHPPSAILIRVLVTAWLLGLTGVLLAYGYWGWALLTLAGAVANIVLAYRVFRATRR